MKGDEDHEGLIGTRNPGVVACDRMYQASAVKIVTQVRGGGTQNMFCVDDLCA